MNCYVYALCFKANIEILLNGECDTILKSIENDVIYEVSFKQFTTAKFTISLLFATNKMKNNAKWYVLNS